jgi:uncharacterized protein YdaU (DUF1376 family)
MPRDKTGHFYYAWYPTIYQQDTQHLTLAECGAYRRLIDHYMLTRAPLPSDDRALARILGIGRDEWEAIKSSITTYFKPSGLFLTHSFCDAELNKDKRRILRSQDNGSKGGRPKHVKDNDNNPVGYSQVRPEQPEQNRTDKLAGDEVWAEEELPSGWHTYAEGKGVPEEQIYKSWRKFKDTTSHPYRLKNWRGWVDRERVRA